MARSPDSEQIFAAKKAGTIARLVGEGVPREQAVAWVESWEGGAVGIHDVRRDPMFWDTGYRYARREFDAGRKPPPPDVSSDGRDPQL